MAIRAPFPATLARRAVSPTLVSACLFRWAARWGSLDAITGQTATLTRASSGTAIDSLGVTYAAAPSMPRWEVRSTLLGLRLSTDDLTWPANWVPQTLTAAVAINELGTRTTAGAGLLYVGNAGQTGARLVIDASSNQYRATIHNGTTSQSVSLATSTPTSLQMATVAVQLEDTGGNQRVRLLLRVAGVDTVTAWSSTVTRAAAWGTASAVRLNRVGSAGTQGATWVRDVTIVPGLASLDDVAERL
jgi:hypothetical protein